MDWRIVIVTWICSLIGQSVGQATPINITYAKALKTQLFTTNQYDPKLLPLYDQADFVFTSVNFYLMAINSVDEKAETIKLTGYLDVYWRDELLVWTSADYNGMFQLFVPQDEIWRPDITLQNTNLQYKPMGHASLNVVVNYLGTVHWYPFEVFESTCSIDITMFPFDTQSCELVFVAWSYSKAEVRMRGGDQGIVLDEFSGNSAWDVVETGWYVREDSADAAIVFTLKLKRKPLYNLLTLVFPVIMLAILNLFVFMLPSDGGEKAGYAVTVFLAFAVFLTIMEASFPQNSDTVAYFAIYVVIQTAQSTVITLIALILVRCASFDESTNIPGWVLAFARFGKCKWIRGKCKKGKARVDVNEGDNGVHKMTLVEVDPENEKKHANKNDNDGNPSKTYTWKYVMNAFDMIFFIFFLFVFLLSTCLCLLLAQY